MMVKIISDFVNVNSGRSFRGAIKSSLNSTHKVVQIGDVKVKNEKASIDFKALIETEIKTSREVTCLEEGQVLIVSKGNDKPVLLLKNVPTDVVCTQHFLVITPKENEDVTAEFLYFYLSSDFAKSWMDSNAGGSYQSSLSKSTLEKLPFPNLSLDKQNTLLRLSESVASEIDLHQKMITLRKSQLNQVLDDLLEKDND